MKVILSIMILMITSLNLYAFTDYFMLKKQDGELVKVTRSDMESLPLYSITTSTNFTPKNDFVGVKFKDIMDKYKLSGDKIRAFAWDGYSFTLPISEMVKYNVIIAYKKGGNYIDISDFGPFAIIYPRDQFPELDKLSVNAKTVWQVKLLEVK